VSETWVPAEIDTSTPSAARVYDCLLGGGHHFPADRQVAEFIVTRLPRAREIAGSNRAFLRRAVLFMVERGITRFLDLGSGIPAVGNVHEIAQRTDPTSRVVYVDYEPVAVAHSEPILSDNDRAEVVRADFTDSDSVLNAAAVRDLLATDEPIGLLMVAVHHFVPDEKDPAGLVALYRDALPPGSYVAISHLTADHDPDGMDQSRPSRRPSSCWAASCSARASASPSTSRRWSATRSPTSARASSRRSPATWRASSPCPHWTG
jgi:hypothetical protein